MTLEFAEPLRPISANTINIMARKEPYRRSRTAINQKAVSDVPLLNRKCLVPPTITSTPASASALVSLFSSLTQTLLEKHGFVRYVTSDSVKPQCPFISAFASCTAQDCPVVRTNVIAQYKYLCVTAAVI